MREYGQIQCSFWTDPDIQSLSDQAKALACYLLTGPHSNGLGCYRLPDGYIVADFGWSSETVSKAFGELFAIGFAKRCERTQFVLLPKFLKWNPISNGNVATARIKEFETVPKKSDVFADLCSSLKRYGKHFPEGFENGFETPSKGYGKQEPTLPNPNKPRKESSASRKTPLPKDFTISDRVREWATEKGYTQLEAHLENFIGQAKAKDYRYVDWDAAFMNAIRKDWAGLRKGQDVTVRAKQLGLEPRPGESQRDYEQRVANAQH